MEGMSERSVKTGVTTPVSTQAVRTAATPTQLAKQAQGVVELFQEWTVCGRRTSAVTIKFCGGFYIFEKDAEYAKNESVKTNLIKSLELEPDKADQYLKRYRSIGAVARELTTIQDALPPALESIYEVSKAFAPGKDAEKKNILDAVKYKRLTTHTSLDDIRAIRNPQKEKPAPAQRKERRLAPSFISAAKSDSPTDDQIVKQAKAQGITSPQKQQEIVKQVRQAESAEAAKVPTPTAIDFTPSSKVSSEEPLPCSFRLEDMTFSDIKVEGTMITGRFVIKDATRHDHRWRAALPPALRRALQDTHL